MSKHRIAQTTDKIRNWRVLTLALAAFIFNTTEFIPVALLSNIAISFNKASHEVGIMMTLYAWIVALLSLPAMLLTAKIERKKLILGIFLIFVIGHIVSVLAPNFTILLLARAAIALAHAIFWSITASLVVRLAPKGTQTKALGTLATGSALATVLGLPLGRMLGQAVGWKTTFGVIGTLALICMVVLWKILPKIPSKNAGTLAHLPAVLTNKPLMMVYITTALVVTAHFTAYSYIEPFTVNINHFNEHIATMILLTFGISGMIASFLFGKFYERFTDKFLLTALFGMTISLSLMQILSNFMAWWFILALIWGISITAISLVLQICTLKLSPKATDIAMSLFSGIYNIGIGGGALLGNLVIAHFSLSYVGYVGAFINIFVILIFYLNHTLNTGNP